MALHTVIETAPYLRDASRFMSEAERKAVVDLVAATLIAGDLIPQGGGIRKLRVPLEGRGKRGGARVIYYLHSVDYPLFLLACFAKDERSDLTMDERQALASALKRLAQTYGA